MTNKLPATIYDLQTPCLLVDIDKVKRNCQRMIDTCNRLGVDFRPHMKTHKTIEGGLLATGGTKKKIVVSTVKEAEFYYEHGFEDILWARPITKDAIPRCQILTNKMKRFHVMFESTQALDWLKESKLDKGKQWSAVMEVDTGYGRTGVRWDDDDLVKLGKAAHDAENVSLLGVYTHCGGSYDCRSEQELEAYGVETTHRMLSIKERLEAAGVTCPTIGLGSTPSCSKPTEIMSKLTEFHPGNYIFYDTSDITIGCCTLDDVAVKVATHVVSHKVRENHIAVDAGFLSLSHDGIKQEGDKFCIIQGHPDLRVTSVTQEIGKISVEAGKVDFDKYPIGSMLFIYPFHSCATACSHRIFYVHSGDKVVGTWEPVSGW